MSFWSKMAHANNANLTQGNKVTENNVPQINVVKDKNLLRMALVLTAYPTQEPQKTDFFVCLNIVIQIKFS